MGGPSRPTNPLSGRLPFKSFTFGNALLSSVGQVLERRGQPTENLPKHKQAHSHARVTNQSDVEDFRSTAAVVMLCSTSYTDEISRPSLYESGSLYNASTNTLYSQSTPRATIDQKHAPCFKVEPFRVTTAPELAFDSWRM